MWNWVKKLDELSRNHEPVVIVTIVRAKGSAPRDAGAKMLVLKDGRIFGTIGGGAVEEQSRQDAKACFASGQSLIKKYDLTEEADQLCGGVVEVFLEPANVRPTLYIFGAGHVGQALCQTMVGTPFDIHIIDEREEWINSAAIPTEVERHNTDWKKFIEGAKWNKENTFVAIMTYSHDLDIKILEKVVRLDTFYLGQIGSRNKWKEFQQQLKTAGIPDKRIKEIHCPIGLPIGGKSPQEISISVAAEILKVYHGK